MPIAESFDFFNPFFSARILLNGPNGKAYPLWTSAGPGQPFTGSGGAGDPLNGLKALSFLSEVTIELVINGPPMMKATLTPPYEDAIKLLDSELIEFGMNMLQVQFGYAKGGSAGTAILSPVYEGRIINTEVSFGENIQIVLNAQGCGGVATSGQMGASKTYTGTIREALKGICLRCGWELKDDLADKDGDTKGLLDQPANYTQAWATDLYALQMLARKAHAVFRFLENDDTGKGVLELVPISTFWAKDSVEHIFSLYHIPQTGLGATVYPIMGANTPMKAMWLGGVRQMLLTEIDEKSKTEVTKAHTHEDLKDATSAQNGAADTKDDTQGATQTVDASSNAGMNQIPGDPNSPKYLESLKAAAQEYKASGWGTPLNINTIGVPTLLPGMSVGVQGLGMRLDTSGFKKKTYTIQKIIHVLNTTGSATQANMIANTGAQIQQAITKPAAGQTPNPDLTSENPDQVKGGK